MKKIALTGILALFVVLMLASSVHAELRFSEVKAYVDGKKDSGASESGGTIDDVKPESNIKFKIKLENTFSDREINNVNVEAVLKDIDDGDDLDDESDDFDLDENDDKSVTFEFDVPLEVDEGTYKLEIKAEGTDNTANRTKHNATLVINVEVEKEKHELHFYLKRLTPETVNCGKNAELEVGIINLGREDEEKITLEVSNQDLDLLEKTAAFDLDEGANDDSIKTVKRFKLSTGNELAVGTYPIQLKASYDKDSKLLTDSVELVVTACEAVAAPKEPAEEQEEVEVSQNTELLQQLANLQAQLDEQKMASEESQVPAKAQPPVTLKAEQKEGFLAKYGVVLVAGLYLLVIAAAVALLIVVFRKKEE